MNANVVEIAPFQDPLPAPIPNQDLASLWALRMLLKTGVPAARWNRRCGDEVTTSLIGIEHHPDPPDRTAEHPRMAPELLRRRLAELEAREPGLEGALAVNLELLAATFRLDHAEKAILAFTCLIKTFQVLEHAADALGTDAWRTRLPAFLSQIVGKSAEDIAQALAPRGTLVRSGLVFINPHGPDLLNYLRFPSGTVGSLTHSTGGLQDLLQHLFVPSPPPRLALGDFTHLGAELSLLLNILRHNPGEGVPAPNILIHGKPGVGKTELVRLLAAEAGIRLLEVATTDEFDTPLEIAERLRAFRVTQHLTRHSAGTAILFDEVDDNFTAETEFRISGNTARGSTSKAWLNQILETAPVPAFWLANDLRFVDSAILRRFDLVLALPPPPRSGRLRLLKQHFAETNVKPEWLERLAEHEDLPPAVIARAGNLMRTFADRGEDATHLADRAIRGTLEAMKVPMRRQAGAASVTPYRVEYLNPDRDLEPVVAGLKGRPEGRLCLYGPPGTGKSAFGAHIARALDRPLMARVASDLMSPYVGVMEKNIAQLFKSAAREEAVLLLDEADSFLRDRTHAQRNWEVTQVNELLTQMESFDGVFIATTNLMEVLDAASLRRFDLKVRFGYLKPDQAWALACEVLAQYGIPVPTDPRYGQQLAQLDNLAPGDFATVVRQARIAGGVQGADGLIEALAAECRAKPDAPRRPIGFHFK